MQFIVGEGGGDALQQSNFQCANFPVLKLIDLTYSKCNL